MSIPIIMKTASFAGKARDLGRSYINALTGKNQRILDAAVSNSLNSNISKMEDVARRSSALYKKENQRINLLSKLMTRPSNVDDFMLDTTSIGGDAGKLQRLKNIGNILQGKINAADKESTSLINSNLGIISQGRKDMEKAINTSRRIRLLTAIPIAAGAGLAISAATNKDERR